MSAKVYKKLAAIIGEGLHLEKKGRNTFHNYNYIREEDVLGLLNEKFGAHGLVVTPSVVETKTEPGKDAKGNDTVITVVEMEFVVADTESGESVAMRWAGSDPDKTGKGVSKALTNATKTFYLKLLRISEEAEDSQRPTERNPAPAPAQPQRESRPDQPKGGPVNKHAEKLKAVTKALAELKGGKPSEHLHRISRIDGGGYIDNPMNPRYADKSKWFEITIEKVKKEIKEAELARAGEQTESDW